mgnify:CR=1 FL=1
METLSYKKTANSDLEPTPVWDIGASSVIIQNGYWTRREDVMNQYISPLYFYKNHVSIKSLVMERFNEIWEKLAFEKSIPQLPLSGLKSNVFPNSNYPLWQTGYSENGERAVTAMFVGNDGKDEQVVKNIVSNPKYETAFMLNRYIQYIAIGSSISMVTDHLHEICDHLN